MPTQIGEALPSLEISWHLGSQVPLPVKCEWSYLPPGDILSHNLDSVFKRTLSAFKYDRNYIGMIIIISLQNKMKIIVTQMSSLLADSPQISWFKFISPLHLFRNNISYIGAATFIYFFTTTKWHKMRICTIAFLLLWPHKVY